METDKDISDSLIIKDKIDINRIYLDTTKFDNELKMQFLSKYRKKLTKEMNMDTPIYPKSKSVRTINLLDNEIELSIIKFGKLSELIQKLRKELYDKDEIIRALEK